MLLFDRDTGSSDQPAHFAHDPFFHVGGRVDDVTVRRFAGSRFAGGPEGPAPRGVVTRGNGPLGSALNALIPPNAEPRTREPARIQRRFVVRAVAVALHGSSGQG